MSVRVLFFGPLTSITGPGPHSEILPAEATVQQLLDGCFNRWPLLRRWDASLLIAVNMAYARREEPIPPDSEVAIMPPVQGG